MSYVLAYHIIFTTYGFWLPNDQRGSGSEVVRAPHLQRFGAATKLLADGNRSVAHRPFDHGVREEARASLKYPHVRLDGTQAHGVAMSIGDTLDRRDVTCLACCVLPDHVHVLVLRRNTERAERLSSALKANASRVLREQGRHPLADYARPDGTLPKVFAEKGRERFVWDVPHLHRCVTYIEDNPVKAGLRPQRWSFVKEIPERYRQA